MKLPPFDYACPTTLPEAVQLLATSNGDAKAIAGGQSLMPVLAFRLARPSVLVDLRRLPGLGEIVVGHDGVQLGAKVRWRDMLYATSRKPEDVRFLGERLPPPLMFMAGAGGLAAPN